MTDKIEAQPESLRLADEQVAALLAIANGAMKFGKLPLEPTEGMEQAAADYLNAFVKAWGLWGAMLSAAPPPPEREPHPPTRSCMCADYLPSFDDDASPPGMEPLMDDQWQALADELDECINRELKNKISAILQLPTE